MLTNQKLSKQKDRFPQACLHLMRVCANQWLYSIDIFYASFVRKFSVHKKYTSSWFKSNCVKTRKKCDENDQASLPKASIRSTLKVALHYWYDVLFIDLIRVL